MYADAEELSEVIISTQARGQRAAINQQFASNLVMNVVSSEKMQELPDANAAAYKEAHDIIDSIESTVDRYAHKLEIVTESDDLDRVAREGKHAIYLGLENGYPLAKELPALILFLTAVCATSRFPIHTTMIFAIRRPTLPNITDCRILDERWWIA